MSNSFSGTGVVRPRKPITPGMAPDDPIMPGSIISNRVPASAGYTDAKPAQGVQHSRGVQKHVHDFQANMAISSGGMRNATTHRPTHTDDNRVDSIHFRNTKYGQPSLRPFPS